MGPPGGKASLCARWPKLVTAAGRCCGVETLMAERSASSFAGICSGRSCAEGSCWRSSRTRCAYCSSITCMRLSSSRMPSSSVMTTTRPPPSLRALDSVVPSRFLCVSAVCQGTSASGEKSAARETTQSGRVSFPHFSSPAPPNSNVSHRQPLLATDHQPFTMLLTPEGFGAVALVGHLAIIAQFVVRCAPTSLPRACAC